MKGILCNLYMRCVGLIIVWLFFGFVGFSQTVTHVTLTCYQPVKEQCDDTPLIPADGSKISLKHLKEGKIKWCAISRDLLWLFPKNKPKRIWIEGYGVYEVRDFINKRHKHRVDILIHTQNTERIFKRNVKIIIQK